MNPVSDARKILENDLPFDYKKIKGERAIIYHYGKQIMIVSGKKYEQLVDAEVQHDALHMQHVLARITGHFKHGNER